MTYQLDDEPAVEVVVRAEYARGANERIRLRHRRREVQILKTVRAEVWPPPEMAEIGARPSHAWFAGYLQGIDEFRRPEWAREPLIAFAVLVEFGGSGGRVTGPLGKQVAQELLDVFGPDLDVDSQEVARIFP